MSRSAAHANGNDHLVGASPASCRYLTLLQADDARADFAAISEDLDFIKAQLGHIPTRKDTTSSRRRTDALSLLRWRERPA
jgi:hypothetical protein